MKFQQKTQHYQYSHLRRAFFYNILKVVVLFERNNWIWFYLKVPSKVGVLFCILQIFLKAHKSLLSNHSTTSDSPCPDPQFPTFHRSQLQRPKLIEIHGVFNWTRQWEDKEMLERMVTVMEANAWRIEIIEGKKRKLGLLLRKGKEGRRRESVGKDESGSFLL